MKYNYKKLISEKNLHKVRLRARQLMGNGTDLVSILYSDKRLVFKTASGTYGKKLMHTQIIEINDAMLEYIRMCDNFKDVETLLRDSSLKIYCSCKAFQYWGVKYWAWKKGYGIEKELRYPSVRNPHGNYLVCKHCYLVLSLYPFWAKALAKRFLNWSASKPNDLPKSRFGAPTIRKQIKEKSKITPPSDIDEIENELNT